MNSFNLIRDQITAQAENSHLYNEDGQLTRFWYDSGGLNIGFGFNIIVNPYNSAGCIKECNLLKAKYRDG